LCGSAGDIADLFGDGLQARELIDLGKAALGLAESLQALKD